MMNNNYKDEATFPELKAGMETLKDCLPVDGIISEQNLRIAMRGKSRWLNRFVIFEIIGMPISILILLGMAVFLHMNIWCIIVLGIAAIPSIILDTRTVGVSQKWIQEESLVDLYKNLCRQKIERKRQTLIETPLALAWIAWFSYEYLKGMNSRMHEIPDDLFTTVWIIVTVIYSLIGSIVVLIIYKKAQNINNEMIKKIVAFTGQE